MDLSTFFDYPDVAVREGADEVVFLPDRSERDWEKLLAHTDSRRFEPGDYVIRAGEVDRSLYIVVDGTLAMLLTQKDGSAKEFKTIEAPSVIGELCFIDGGPRSSSLRAVTPGEVRRLSYESFEVLAAREPELARAILFDLGRILSQRLRTMTDFVAEWIA